MRRQYGRPTLDRIPLVQSRSFPCHDTKQQVLSPRGGKRQTRVLPNRPPALYFGLGQHALVTPVRGRILGSGKDHPCHHWWVPGSPKASVLFSDPPAQLLACAVLVVAVRNLSCSLADLKDSIYRSQATVGRPPASFNSTARPQSWAFSLPFLSISSLSRNTALLIQLPCNVVQATHTRTPWPDIPDMLPPTPPARPSVPLPTPTRTGPRFPTWPSDAGYRTELLR